MKFSKRLMTKWIKEAKAYVVDYWGFKNTAECTYCYLDNRKDTVARFIGEVNTACHAGVSRCTQSYGRVEGKIVPFMVDNICYFRGKRNATLEQRIRFLQYVMDHPILGQSFIEHDAKKALKESMMIRDLSRLPSNVMMFCLILTRSLWEGYQDKIIPRFCELVDRGFNSDDALVLSHLVDPHQDGTYKYSPVASTGHNAVDYITSTVGYLKNYHHHKMVSISPGTILEGFGTGGIGYSVFSVFREVNKNTDYTWARLEPLKNDSSLGKWVKENLDNLLEATNKLTGEE